MFVLDASGSVQLANFRNLLDFVATVTSGLGVSPTGSHVGVVRYSTSAQLLIGLGSDTDPTQLEARIRAISYPGGFTATGTAIALAHRPGFQNSRQSQGVPSVMMVLTDGNTNTGPQPAGPAAAAIADGIHILAVGIGNGINEAQLKTFASGPDSVFLINGFTPEDFDEVIRPLRDAACSSKCNSNLKIRGIVTFHVIMWKPDVEVVKATPDYHKLLHHTLLAMKTFYARRSELEFRFAP